MKENFVAAWSVVMLMMLPGLTVDGASVMLGRTAGVPSEFSRYGGVKIWTSGWFCLQGGSRDRCHSPARELCVVRQSHPMVGSVCRKEHTSGHCCQQERISIRTR